MGLSIICAGYARTGTSSLAEALEHLGFGPCYTISVNAIATRTMASLWDRALSHASVDWERIFEGFTVVAAQRHNEEVRRSIPADRLLVYQVSEGWPPLCEFLGIGAIPDVPFPHVKEKAYWSRSRSEMREEYAKLYAEGWT